MTVLPAQTGAILEAQWRVLWNKLPRMGGASFVFGLAFSVLWYGMIVGAAVAIAVFIPEIRTLSSLQSVLKIGLLLGFLYWLVIPLVLVTTGLSLDLKRLLVYPIPPAQLFGIEVLLRVTTAVEVFVLLLGAIFGLIRHPLVPTWGPLALVLFGLFNMFLSVGIRDLLTRLLQRKFVRESLVFVLVIVSVLPQWLARSEFSGRIGQWYSTIPEMPWPWTATALLATGSRVGMYAAVMVAWTLLAWAFARWQFRTGLNTDMAELRAAGRSWENSAAQGWSERFYRIPSYFLPDPAGALVEKEIRTLFRSSRFRLVFLMGFTFGLVIWLPLIFDRGPRSSFVTDNFLVLVTLYAALLLGEVLFWNSFGFDRQAAQAYFVMPVRFPVVLIAKNLTAMFFLILEVAMVTAVCLALPFRLPMVRVAEAFCVTLVWGFLLLALGNLASTRFPKAANPADSWRKSGNAKVGLLLLFLYPILGIPLGLAYLARYAFQSEAAFFVVIGINALVGATIYWVALDSASKAAETRREEFLSALSTGDSPMA